VRLALGLALCTVAGGRRMGGMTGVRSDGSDVLLEVKVVPGASRTRLAGAIGERLKIAVAAPPEKGRANAAVTKLLAKECGLRRQDVTVESGATSPRKTIRLRGRTVEAVKAALGLTG